MKTTSQQLLSATDHGLAAGNYDGTTGDFNGDAVKAADIIQHMVHYKV